MKYDTEEAFFKATYFFSQTAPIDIGEAARKNKEKNDVDRIVTGEAVKMMRGAFKAHQRAEASPTPLGESLLNYRIFEAAKELPPEWRIVLMVEKNVVSVDLYNAADEPQELPDTDGDLSRSVVAALRIAKGSA